VNADDHARLTAMNLQWRKSHPDSARFKVKEYPSMSIPKTLDFRSTLRKQTDSAAKHLDALLVPMSVVHLSLSVEDAFGSHHNTYDVGNGELEDMFVATLICSCVHQRKAQVIDYQDLAEANWHADFRYLREVIYQGVLSVMRENKLVVAHLRTLRISGSTGPPSASKCKSKSGAIGVKVVSVYSETKEFAFAHPLGKYKEQEEAKWTDDHGCRSKGNGPLTEPKAAPSSKQPNEPRERGRKPTKRARVYDDKDYESEGDDETHLELHGAVGEAPESEVESNSDDTDESESEPESESAIVEPRPRRRGRKLVEPAPPERSLEDMLRLRKTVIIEKSTGDEKKAICWDSMRDQNGSISPHNLSCDRNTVSFLKSTTGAHQGLVRVGRVICVSNQAGRSILDANVIVQWKQWRKVGVDVHGRVSETLEDGDEMPERWADLTPELPNVVLAEGPDLGLEWAMRVAGCNSRQCTLCNMHVDDLGCDDGDRDAGECSWCGCYYHHECWKKVESTCTQKCNERGVSLDGVRDSESPRCPLCEYESLWLEHEPTGKQVIMAS